MDRAVDPADGAALNTDPLRASKHHGVTLGEPFTQFTAEERRDLKEESRIMTSGTPSPGAPAPQAPSPGKPVRRWPDPGTPWGAVLYAVIAGLIVWIIIGILSHIHILITWHLSPSTARSVRFRLHPAEGKDAKTISTYTEAHAPGSSPRTWSPALATPTSTESHGRDCIRLEIPVQVLTKISL